MRTCAADCLSTPLTSQMVGRTWTCSESESSSLLCHSGVPLAAPHLSVTLCLKYICAAAVSHLGSSLAKMTQMSYCSLMFPYVQYYCNFPSHQTRTLPYTFPLQSQQVGGFIDSSNHTLYQQMCFKLSATRLPPLQ